MDVKPMQKCLKPVFSKKGLGSNPGFPQSTVGGIRNEVKWWRRSDG